jgi:hypothetical protein
MRAAQQVYRYSCATTVSSASHSVFLYVLVCNRALSICVRLPSCTPASGTPRRTLRQGPQGMQPPQQSAGASRTPIVVRCAVKGESGAEALSACGCVTEPAMCAAEWTRPPASCLAECAGCGCKDGDIASRARSHCCVHGTGDDLAGRGASGLALVAHAALCGLIRRMSAAVQMTQQPMYALPKHVAERKQSATLNPAAPPPVSAPPSVAPAAASREPRTVRIVRGPTGGL